MGVRRKEGRRKREKERRNSGGRGRRRKEEPILTITEEDKNEDEKEGTIGIIMDCGPLVDVINTKTEEKREVLKWIFRKSAEALAG